jgi:uncharacterized protein YcsI (UPF0317 family)
MFATTVGKLELVIQGLAHAQQHTVRLRLHCWFTQSRLQRCVENTLAILEHSRVAFSLGCAFNRWRQTMLHDAVSIHNARFEQMPLIKLEKKRLTFIIFHFFTNESFKITSVGFGAAVRQ